MKKILEYLKTNLGIKVVVATFLLGLIIVALGYTYAFFQVRVERENVFTMIVANLDYRITSSSLNDKSEITLAPHSKKTIEFTITNMSEIKSHFKLYYLANDEVRVFYQENEVYRDELGTLDANKVTTLVVMIENKSENDAVITFGVQGGLLNRVLTLNQGTEIKKTEKKLCLEIPNEPVILEG